MIKFSLLLFAFNSVCLFGHAQMIIEGRILNSSNQQPVQFAALGLKGKNIGSVANENGVFHFEVDNGIDQNETLVISSVGFQTATIFLARFKTGKQTIMLAPSNTTLQSVNVKPEKFKTKVFGRTGNSTMMLGNMFTERNHVDDNLGREQATILSIDKHCFVKDFNMLVAFNKFESVKFRLNFYNVKDGEPDQLIVDKDILFDVTQKNGWLKVDLEKYNIYLDGYDKIAVGIQWVKSVRIDSTSKSFGVSVTPVPLHSMFFRDKSQAGWKKMSTAYLAFNITVDSFKPGKDTNTDQTDEKVTLNDTLKNYLNYTRFAAVAIASGYGNNTAVGNYINVNQAKLYYEIYGAGEPLLLLHGNGLSISSFYKQVPELAKHYKVIAADTRGQGQSTDYSTEPLKYELFAADMRTLLDSLHLKQVNMVGWSDGGITGLIMAIKYPDYVKKLAIMGANLNPSGVNDDLLNSFKMDLVRPAKNTAASMNQQRLLALLVNEPQITDDELQTIKAPVLVLAGEKDLIKLAHTREIADHIKNSKLLIIKEATHYAPQEKPQEFNVAVLNFLKQ